jgi:beta-lactamase class A
MRSRIAFIILTVALAAGLIGWYAHGQYELPKSHEAVQIRENSAKYHYINPLLYTNNPEQDPEYTPLKKLLDTYTANAKRDGLADSISVYFRDLDHGYWTGIDEDTTYIPASLLKVFVMISYLKEAESTPAIISRKLSYTAEVDPGQYYKPEHPLGTGSYTIRELINEMITNSDNAALNLLLNKGSNQTFTEAYTALQLPPVPANSKDVVDYMSPKSYSALFRILYNASYLSRTASDNALKLLSETTFNNGLVAGVPTGLTVAHKFGEHSVLAQDNSVYSRELHDCGIVYLPKNPYFLCVMTKGAEFPKLEQVISSISKITYDEMISTGR